MDKSIIKVGPDSHHGMIFSKNCCNSPRWQGQRGAGIRLILLLVTEV